MRTFRLLNQKQANKKTFHLKPASLPSISNTCPPARTLVLGEYKFRPRLEITDRTPGPRPLLRSCDRVHQQNKDFSFNLKETRLLGCLSCGICVSSLSCFPSVQRPLSIANPETKWVSGCRLFSFSASLTEILMFLVYITFKVCFLKL